MPPRRGTPSINTLSPPDLSQSSSTGRSPVTPNSLPRSASPSTGFAQLLTKPSRWFTRSNSSGSVSGGRTSFSNEPRASTSSGRKPKISHPTDPRPILDQLRPEPASALGMSATSRSVLDLSLARTTSTFDPSPNSAPRTPQSPTHGTPSRGLGDLRSISRKPWSKSADDLGKISHPSNISPLNIDTSFQGKINQYRNHRNDSLGSSLSQHDTPISQSPPSYPFPVITTNDNESLSSSPPHRSGVLSAASSPASVVTPPLTPASPGHVHSRSHSFTPRLPSKLSAQKLVPPSPNRKGSASSEHELNRDKFQANTGSLGSGPQPRPGFPFGFNGATGGNRSISPMGIEAHSPLDKPGASPALLAPPTIIEPGDNGSDTKSERRTSQVVFHSGFINKLGDFSPAGANARANHSYMSGGGLTLAKGWKPFKLVLKGSKLYFYKPPSDRSTAVKELFPTELVVVLEDEGLVDELETKAAEPEDVQRSLKGKDREESRRKRTFWGTSTHPGLVVGEDGITKGSFEALVHEAVFSTTFVNSMDSLAVVHEEADDEHELKPHYKSEWKDFSAAVIFTLPAYVGRSQFETEFRRCSDMLINSGEDADSQEEARKKVSSLADQYVIFYGSAVDNRAWQDWRNVIGSSISSEVSGMPQSASTQGLFVPTPDISFADSSPNLGTFSPRPGTDNRIISLLDALGEQPGTRGSSNSGPVKAWRTALENNGFTRDVLMSVDPQAVARSLFTFHQQALHQIPDNITANFFLGPELLIDSDETATAPGVGSPSSVLAPFLGNDDSPHWLTKVILLQILIADSPPVHSSQSIGRSSGTGDDRSHRMHSRADVISAWVRIANFCRRTGDECSWRAIVAAICSRPIARLDKVWKRVDGDAVRLVQSWVYSQDSSDDAMRLRNIPWAGERDTQIKEVLGTAYQSASSEWRVQPLLQAWQAFEGIRADFALCSKKADLEDVEESDEVRALVQHWRLLAAQGGGNVGMAAKFKRIDQFVSLSLAAEPRRKGMFEPYYWSRPQMPQTLHPLTPLLFPEPLPTVAFINRSVVTRGRMESSASLNMPDFQHLRELKQSGDVKVKTPDAKQGSNIEVGKTVIMVFEGELVLLAQPGDTPSSRPQSRAPSRPPSGVSDAHSTEQQQSFSRNPSVRVRPGSKRLERKPSQLRRSSLPALSRKPSFETAEIASERPLRVIVQAGTLDRLVDVLVEGLHGVSVSVADDNGEMPLVDKKTRELRVDMQEFAKVWWSTFRSFVTPHVLFELLRKRYLATQLISQSPSPIEVSNVVRKRVDVLETIKQWIYEGGGAQDTLDDPQLFSSFQAFLRHPTDHAPPDNVSTDIPQVRHGFAVIEEVKQSVSVVFTTQTMRPAARTVSASEASADKNAPSYGSQPPDVDQIQPEDLVSNLDAMASATFRNVTQEDLFVAADILEVQSADRLGWFLAHEPPAISDEVEIQSIHNYLRDVEPSSMISELSQDSVYRLLPPAIRGCIKAFIILRTWLISRLVTLKIGLKVRQERMELMLKALEICRIRNTERRAPDSGSAERPVVRSFVEAALTSAVISVESRTYHRAWQMTASARGVSCDTLATMLSKPAINSVVHRDPLTVDMGWLLERTLEIIATSDVVESQQEGSLLINFDKRRSLYTLLTNSSPLGSHRKTRHRSEVNRRDFERLNAIEQEANSFHFDLRAIREDAHREATQVAAAISRRQPRPFQTLVAAQQEKNKRDRSLRDRLSREKRQEQQQKDRMEEALNKAMHPRKQAIAVQKQHRNKKSVSSAFFQFMRPISSAFLSDYGSTAVKRSVEELDFVPSGKPHTVLNIVDARVSQFINNERSFTFQVDTEDGGHYLFQATNKAEMKKWMNSIDKVSKLAAKRRLTYLGHNSKVQMSEHLLTNNTPSRDPRAVFGVELNYLLQRESAGGEVQLGSIPTVIERLIDEVESRGLTEIGIYRVAGSHSEVNALRDALNKGEWPIESHTDINAVCDLIKSWFRVLPGGMFPSPFHVNMMDVAAKTEIDLETKLSKVREVVHGLPSAHFALLKRLIEHLDKVTDYEEYNHMTAESLATVFSPNLLRSANDDVSFFFANMGSAHRATKMLITHTHVIFNEAEPDHEVDQDGDSIHEPEPEQFDEPIPEEDEEEDTLLSAGHESSDDEEERGTQSIVQPHPPVLDIALPSPTDLSIPMS